MRSSPFAALPETLKVYRGYVRNRNKRGLSYTLNLDKARWFAKRFDKNGEVLMRTIKKKKVFAYTNQRSEEEIIIV